MQTKSEMLTRLEKTTTNNLEKLLKKLAAFVESCEELHGLRIVYQNKVTVKYLKKLRKKLYRMKVEEYKQKLYVCGDRNSYSKTDQDATFMRMKEDAMGNGHLKAGYNI